MWRQNSPFCGDRQRPRRCCCCCRRASAQQSPASSRRRRRRCRRRRSRWSPRQTAAASATKRARRRASTPRNREQHLHQKNRLVVLAQLVKSLCFLLGNGLGSVLFEGSTQFLPFTSPFCCCWQWSSSNTIDMVICSNFFFKKIERRGPLKIFF